MVNRSSNKKKWMTGREWKDWPGVREKEERRKRCEWWWKRRRNNNESCQKDERRWWKKVLVRIFQLFRMRNDEMIFFFLLLLLHKTWDANRINYHSCEIHDEGGDGKWKFTGIAKSFCFFGSSLSFSLPEYPENWVE